jgi:hypothetical protein
VCPFLRKKPPAFTAPLVLQTKHSPSTGREPVEG